MTEVRHPRKKSPILHALASLCSLMRHGQPLALIRLTGENQATVSAPISVERFSYLASSS